MTIFDSIKESCRDVCGRASHVRIIEESIHTFSDRLPENKEKGHKSSVEIDPARHFRDGRDQTIEFVCLLNAVNFGSGFRDELWIEKSLPSDKRFYSSVMSSLHNYVNDNGQPEATQWLDADLDFYARVFGLPIGHPASSELLKLFQKSIQNYAYFLHEHYDGMAVRLFDECNGTASKLIEKLIQIPSYQDAAIYKSMPVFFYKRAQITAADLFFALEKSGEAFHDINQLTAFADPALPQVLSYFGVLEYSNDLERKIVEGVELLPGCEEEVEIRAATVHAIEKIKGYCPFWRVIDIDDILWRMAGDTDLSGFPRHKTKTIFY